MYNRMIELDAFDWNNPKEVKIQLPIGNIAGKWWGPTHIRPILCLHGWQDNAGSFDAIIPLLPKHISYLAIDLPGHGYSFRNPTGIVYNCTDLPFLIKLIVDVYRWKKVSIISHSMSILASYLYTGLLPNDLDFMVSLDTPKPPYLNPKFLFDNLSSCLQNYVKWEKQAIYNNNRQTYTYDETIEKLCKGSGGSITKEAAPHLLKRGIAPSKLDPTKYYFTHDNRLKLSVFKMAQNDFLLMLAEKMCVPYLFIKAENKIPPFVKESIEKYDEAVATLKKYNPNFEYHSVEGSHHIHLTEPNKISEILSEFIGRKRPIYSDIDDVNKNNRINCKL